MKTLQFKKTNLDMESWIDLITDMKCPDCKEPITVYDLGNMKFHGCPECKQSYWPPAPVKKGKPVKKRSLVRKEIAARKSGVSVLERLDVYYHCDVCDKRDKAKREAINRELKSQGMPERENVGDDGMVDRQIPNVIHVLHDVPQIIPFSCKCGKRYHCWIKVKEHTDYTSYKVIKGYHDTCFACQYAWNKALDEEFLYFRCDIGIGNCRHPTDIENVREHITAYVEEEIDDEQDNQRRMDQP